MKPFLLLSLTLGIDISTFYSGSVHTEGAMKKKYLFFTSFLKIPFNIKVEDEFETQPDYGSLSVLHNLLVRQKRDKEWC